MEDYIVCEKKGNRPRIHVKICQHRCKVSKRCQPFQDYVKAHGTDEVVMTPEARAWSPEKDILRAAP